MKNNEVLLNMLKNSVEGKKIYLSATFIDNDIKQFKHFELYKRYHNHPLDMPKFIFGSFIKQLFLFSSQVQQYQKNKKRLLVFLPTIKQLNLMRAYFTFLHIKCFITHSKNQDDIKNLKKEKSYICLTTTILERGITIDNLDVIIFNGDHQIFDYQTMIQICGRVGRSYLYPSGKITIYAKENSQKFTMVKNYITTANEDVSYLSKKN